MIGERKHDQRGWGPKIRRLGETLRLAFRPPVVRVQLPDKVLLEGAIAQVGWHTTGALYVRVTGYGRCRRHGAMRVVVSPPLLDLEIVAYGLIGRTTVHVQRLVQPITLRKTALIAAPFRAQVNGPALIYEPETAIQSSRLGYAMPQPAFRHDLPVVHGRMPHRIELEEPELNHHHAVQGLLNA